MDSQLEKYLTTDVHFDNHIQNTYNHAATQLHMIDEGKSYQ